MKKLVNEFCRKENIQTWAPMFLSFCGIFGSPLIGCFFEQYPCAFWIAFAVSAICGGLFVVLSVKYLKKWHSIITLLRNGNNDHLLEIATYIATTEGIKERNSDFTLSRVDVSYTAGDPQDDPSQKYPLGVKYEVVGTVHRRMSSVHFYVLARKTTSGNPKVSYQFSDDGEPSPARKAEERAGITHYILTNHKEFKPDEIIKYTIFISFPPERGLSTHASQRFLLDPRNFSVDCQNATVVFHVALPENVFEIPQVDVFTDGLNRNKDGGPYSLKGGSTEILRGKLVCKTYFSTELSAKADRLYAVVFSPSKAE